MRHIGAIAAFAAVALATAAQAHPQLRAASPTPGSALAASPPEIRITFNEPLVAAFSGLELKDRAGKSVDIGRSAVDPKTRRQIVAPIKAPLAAGTYTVDWHAVAADTHHVSGHYSFHVKR